MAMNAEESRRVIIRAITCKGCRFYTWAFIVQPIKDAHGDHHHPNCPSLKAKQS